MSPNSPSDIRPVLLAGGTGTRLWPLSRAYWPKQYLALGRTHHTLLQEAYLRMRSFSRDIEPLIITNRDLSFIAKNQIGQLGFDSEMITESTGRGTAAACVISALKVAETNPEGVLVFLPADHYVADQEKFAQDILQGVEIANHGQLVTLCIKPDRAETGYGYIKKGEPFEGGYRVDNFFEKPDLETAKKWFEAGEYFWNAGYYIGKAEVLLQEVEKYEPDLLEAAKKAWSAAERVGSTTKLSGALWESVKDESIDKGVAERTDKLVTIIHTGRWNDLGNYEALWREEEKDEFGNVIHGQVVAIDSHNNYLRAPRRSVATLGLENTVVVADDDFILIADRSQTNRINEALQKVRDRGWDDPDQPVRTHRPWGWYERLVSRPTYQCKRICVFQGQALSLQSHDKRTEHWVITKGTAELTLGLETKEIHANDTVFIPTNTKHRLRNIGKESVEWIEVQTGSYFGEDDIVRYEDDYGRISE